MQTRLLAFLSETERAVRAERPEPAPGAQWETTRSVNYRLGLARLTLGARTASGELRPMGGLLLQSFELADQTVCLRATVTWQNSGSEISHPIFAKPLLDWGAEAERLATVWMSGPPAAILASPVEAAEPALLAAG